MRLSAAQGCLLHQRDALDDEPVGPYPFAGRAGRAGPRPPAAERCMAPATAVTGRAGLAGLSRRRPVSECLTLGDDIVLARALFPAAGVTASVRLIAPRARLASSLLKAGDP